jgi:hypothetical protein
VTLLERLNITPQYYIGKPGRYTVQHRGERSFDIDEAGIPPSNIVEMHVHPGELPVADVVIGRLLEIMPEKPSPERYTQGKWELSRWGSGDVKPDGRARGKGFMIALILNLTGYKDDLIGCDICVMEKPAEGESPEPAFVSEYLGRSQWGHVYIAIPPEALKHWPDVRERVAKALNTQNK